MRIQICALAVLLATPAVASECLTPPQAHYAVPIAEETQFENIQLLEGPAYKFWMAMIDDTGPKSADSVMVFFTNDRKGPGADVPVVFFSKGCAVAKGHYPAQFWTRWAMVGKDM